MPTHRQVTAAHWHAVAVTPHGHTTGGQGWGSEVIVVRVTCCMYGCGGKRGLSLAMLKAVLNEQRNGVSEVIQ